MVDLKDLQVSLVRVQADSGPDSLLAVLVKGGSEARIFPLFQLPTNAPVQETSHPEAPSVSHPPSLPISTPILRATSCLN